MVLKGTILSSKRTFKTLTVFDTTLDGIFQSFGVVAV